jgi:hypothetical protein
LNPWPSQTSSAGIKPAGCAAAKRLPKRGCGQDSAGEDSRTTSSGANSRSAHSLDFLCRDARLIVEVDGATHSEDHEIVYDERRSAYLKAQGYRIVRVMNDDVYRRFDDVMDMILLALEGKLPEA